MKYARGKYRITYINRAILYEIWNQSGRNREKKKASLAAGLEWCKLVSDLESEFQRGLHLSHVGCRSLILSEAWRGQGADELREVWMIENVVELPPEQKVLVFSDLRIFENREIRIGKASEPDLVASTVADVAK